MEELTTTTIGSFPLPMGVDGFRRSLQVQVEAGVDYPAVPQLEDFCVMFLREIAEKGKGIERRGEQFILSGPIEPPKEPSIVRDVSFALTVLKDMNVAKGLKVQVTGPFTLSSLVKFLDKTVMSYPDLVENFADAIAEMLISTLSFEEVEVAFVDEPALRYALWYGYDDNFVAGILNRIFKRLHRDVERGLHVCGDARGLSVVTLKLDVDILHHEYAGFSKNFEAYSLAELISTGKMLGIGAVTTRPVDSILKIESVEEVEKLLKKALATYGPRIIVAPDCGFRGLLEFWRFDEAIDVAFRKLKVMVEASKKIRDENSYL